jgi:hypothetical protein
MAQRNVIITSIGYSGGRNEPASGAEFAFFRENNAAARRLPIGGRAGVCTGRQDPRSV